MALSPPGVSAVLVAASVIRAYCQSVRGNAITGSETSCLCKLMNDFIAGSGRGPPLYPESFLVSQNNGAAITAKSLMCIRKKLHNLTKERIVLTSLGGLAVWIALSLFFPGLFPSGVSMKPKLDTSLFPKMHLSKLILR